jgi:hypothetical protein
LWFRANPVKTKQLFDYKVEYLTCEFKLFGGRRLNSGWRVALAQPGQRQVGPIYGIVLFSKAPSGDDPSMTIQVPLPGGVLSARDTTFLLSLGEQAGYLEKLVIEGPTTDWHDAFRR